MFTPRQEQEEETAAEEGDLDAAAILDSIGDVYGDITLVDKALRLKKSVDVYPEPKESAKPLGHLESGTMVHHVGKLEDWSLVGWPSAKPTAFGWIRLSAEPEPDADEPEENGIVRGSVSFVGTPPEMKVPAQRKKAEFCKTSTIEHNAVLVARGRLQDVYVRLRGVKGTWQPPDSHAALSFRGCVLAPRVQGVMAGETIEISNVDGTLHSAHAISGSTSLFNEPLPKGTPTVEKNFFEEGFITFTCDTHPWERAFVVVTDNPFFAVTGSDGEFVINDVPEGTYVLEAWHSQFGNKREQNVHVTRGRATELRFIYDSHDRPPRENPSELRGLF